MKVGRGTLGFGIGMPDCTGPQTRPPSGTRMQSLLGVPGSHAVQGTGEISVRRFVRVGLGAWPTVCWGVGSAVLGSSLGESDGDGEADGVTEGDGEGEGEGDSEGEAEAAAPGAVETAGGSGFATVAGPCRARTAPRPPTTTSAGPATRVQRRDRHGRRRSTASSDMPPCPVTARRARCPAKIAGQRNRAGQCAATSQLGPTPTETSRGARRG